MSRVFVTGASGTCGGFVIRELLQQGHDVTAHSHRPTTIAGCMNVSAELFSLATIATHIRESDAVVHLASTRSTQRNLVVTNDILGTGTLLDLWTHGSFVYASSQMVYGVPKEPMTEQTRIEPSSWYDMGKVACEFQVAQACDRNGRGPGISLRLPVVLSASNGKAQTLDMLYRDAQRGVTFVFDSEESLEVSGSDYIGVRDLAGAVALSLALPESGPYNVSGGYFTWKELIDELNRLTGTNAQYAVRERGPLGANEGRLTNSRSQLDGSRFASATGFTPAETVEAIVSEYVASRGFFNPLEPELDPAVEATR